MKTTHYKSSKAPSLSPSRDGRFPGNVCAAINYEFYSPVIIAYPYRKHTYMPLKRTTHRPQSTSAQTRKTAQKVTQSANEEIK